MKKTKGVTVQLSPEIEEMLNRPLPQAPETAGMDNSPYDPEADPEFVASYLKLEFVEELRNVMYKRGLTGSGLARKLGKSRQAVSKALNSDDPDNFTIEKMAELVTAVGVRVSITVHEPGTMVVTKPIANTTFMVDDLPYAIPLWQPAERKVFRPGLGSGTETLRANAPQYKTQLPLSKKEMDQDEQRSAA